jgi:hypothetical protein
MSQEENIVRNPNLYRSYQDLCSSGLSLVKSYLNKDIPKKKIRRIIQKEDYIETPELEVDDFYKFVKIYEEQIFNLLAYRDFLAAVKGDMVVCRHFDTSVGTFMHVEYNSSKEFVLFLISRLVENYQVENNTHDQLIQKMYLDLETFIYSETLPVVDIVPLDNFNSNMDTLSLANGAVLREDYC